MKLRVLGTLFAVSLLGAGCQGAGEFAESTEASRSPQQGGTLRVIRGQAFDGWVGDAATTYVTYTTQQAVIEPLVRFGADGVHLRPGLAKSWQYDEDKLTWTFVLQKEARFSDGSAVTSADVAFSAGVWKKGPNFGASYQGIDRVKTPDDRTVVFELAYPDSTLPVALSWSVAGVLPKDFAGMSKDDYYAAPIGAGPFKVEEWTPGGRIVLTRNEHFYDAELPYVDKVVIDVVSDVNERAILFQGGEADIVEYVPVDTASQYGDDLVVLPRHNSPFLSMNTTRPSFDDVNARRAVAHAIDYKGIYDGALKGYADAPTGPLPPNIAHWAPPSESYFSQDLREAEQLSPAALGDAPVELLYDTTEGQDTLIAQIVQSSLAEVGVDVKLVGLETGTFIDRLYGGEFDLAVWAYGAISPDMVDPIGWLLATANNFAGSKAGLLASYNRYIAADTDAAKKAVVTEVQDKLATDVPFVTLAEASVLYAAASGVRGLAVAPWGVHYYDTIWLEQ
jgi:peptide/nickel transport system substrate-binding protein